VGLVGRVRKATAGVAGGRRSGKDDVIAHPERRHPMSLRLAGERHERLARGDRPLGRKMTADLHGASPPGVSRRRYLSAMRTAAEPPFSLMLCPESLRVLPFQSKTWMFFSTMLPTRIIRPSAEKATPWDQ